jgi:hypothetical protein
LSVLNGDLSEIAHPIAYHHETELFSTRAD